MPQDGNGHGRQNRRRFLKGMAIPAAAALAGCSGNGGSDGGSGGSDGGSGSGGGGDTATPTETPSLSERAQQEGVCNIVASASNTAPFFKQQMADELGIGVSYQFKDFAKTATQLVQGYNANKVTIDMSGSATTGDPITLKELAKQEIIRQIPQDVFENDEYVVEPMLDRRVAHVGYGKALTVMYNEEIVDNPPKTYDELFVPEYKGKITVDVRDSELVPAFRNVFDDESRVKEVLSNFGEWAAPFSSHFDAAKAIARGEYPMGITYIKYANYEWGGPLAELPLENFPPTAGLSTFWLPAKAPHPAAGELSLRYSARNANWIDYYKGVAGENVYFSIKEAKQGEFDPDSAFIATPKVMRQSDPSEWENKWHEYTGFKE